MLALSTTAWWTIGFALGGVIVLVVAVLLLAIVALGRRIGGQAAAITVALDGARENTNAMFDVAAVNHNLDRITRGLRAAREGL